MSIDWDWFSDVVEEIQDAARQYQVNQPTVRPGGGGVAFTGDTGLGTSGAVDDTSAPPSWSSSDTRFYGIRDLLVTQSGLTISDTSASRVLDDYGARFYADHGRFPTYTELRGDGTLFAELTRSALRTDLLPPVYGVRGADGEIQFYDNSGAFPTEIAKPGTLWAGTYAQVPQAPIYSQGEYDQIINWDAMGAPRGSGSGRGGQVFDKAQMDEYITRSWGSLMLQEPPPGLTKRFIKASNAFWAQGGSLDLETWLKDQMRATARYRVLYGRKDPSMSEEQHLSLYSGLARQTGVRPALVTRFTVRGAAGAGAPAAFANMLTETAEVQGLGTGQLSRQFAQIVSGIPS